MDTLERTHVVTDPAILYFGTRGVSGLTPVPADLIAPPLVAECPVVMKCTVDGYRRSRSPCGGARVARHPGAGPLVPSRLASVDEELHR